MQYFTANPANGNTKELREGILSKLVTYTCNSGNQLHKKKTDKQTKVYKQYILKGGDMDPLKLFISCRWQMLQANSCTFSSPSPT